MDWTTAEVQAQGFAASVPGTAEARAPDWRYTELQFGKMPPRVEDAANTRAVVHTLALPCLCSSYTFMHSPSPKSSTTISYKQDMICGVARGEEILPAAAKKQTKMPSNQIAKLIQLSNQCVDEVDANLKAIGESLGQLNLDPALKQQADTSCQNFASSLGEVRQHLSSMATLCNQHSRGDSELEPVKQTMQTIDSRVNEQLDKLNEMLRGIMTKAKEAPGLPEATIGILVTESRNTVDSCLQLKELLVTIDSELFAPR